MHRSLIEFLDLHRGVSQRAMVNKPDGILKERNDKKETKKFEASRERLADSHAYEYIVSNWSRNGFTRRRRVGRVRENTQWHTRVYI